MNQVGKSLEKLQSLSGPMHHTPKPDFALTVRNTSDFARPRARA
jgi:hypothetical protein